MTLQAQTGDVGTANDSRRPDDAAMTEELLVPYAAALRGAVPDRETLLAEARAQTAQQRKRRTQRLRATGSALALAVVAGVWAVDPAWRSQELRTAVGERSSVTLSDGSRIQLNTGSVLRVQSNLRSRQIALVQGEALFTVTHGWRPFVVHAPGATIRDIGTVFNVRLQAAGLRVTVLEGAVEVRPAHSDAASAAQEVRAGQMWSGGGSAGSLSSGSAAGTAAGTVSAADSEQATAWRHGKLVFDGTPLAEVVAELQRYRRAPIRVADAAAARMRVSGEYDLAGVEALIDALPATLPVRVERAADGSASISARR